MTTGFPSSRTCILVYSPKFCPMGPRSGPVGFWWGLFYGPCFVYSIFWHVNGYRRSPALGSMLHIIVWMDATASIAAHRWTPP